MSPGFPSGCDLVDRGLRAPGLVVADGAPGLWKAARELWPSAAEQRCTVHALRQGQVGTQAPFAVAAPNTAAHEARSVDLGNVDVGVGSVACMA